MQRTEFVEAVLSVMDRKTHWAWPLFTSGKVPAERLHLHFEQEYEVYVRDFPLLIGAAYVQCPVAAVRQELAENIYEEETGGLTAGKPHPELFLEYPKGLGMDLSRFDSVTLLPAARAYKDWLDTATRERGWATATCVSTIFVEGTNFERGEIDSSHPKRPVVPLEQHPLVVHYGLPLESLALTRAHRQVEGEHRGAAWRILLQHLPNSNYPSIVESMETTLERWTAYRDSVAEAVGLTRALHRP